MHPQVCAESLSCATLCDPTDYSPPGSSVHGILQARVLEWVAMLLQGISPTQGSNPGLPHCRRILYHLSHQGTPSIIHLSIHHLSIHPSIHPISRHHPCFFTVIHLCNYLPIHHPSIISLSVYPCNHASISKPQIVAQMKPNWMD